MRLWWGGSLLEADFRAVKHLLADNVWPGQPGRCDEQASSAYRGCGAGGLFGAMTAPRLFSGADHCTPASACERFRVRGAGTPGGSEAASARLRSRVKWPGNR
jgi:hypothetical protein